MPAASQVSRTVSPSSTARTNAQLAMSSFLNTFGMTGVNKSDATLVAPNEKTPRTRGVSAMVCMSPPGPPAHRTMPLSAFISLRTPPHLCDNDSTDRRDPQRVPPPPQTALQERDDRRRDQEHAQRAESAREHRLRPCDKEGTRDGEKDAVNLFIIVRRPSTPRCSRSSISSRAISQRRRRARSCACPPQLILLGTLTGDAFQRLGSHQVPWRRPDRPVRPAAAGDRPEAAEQACRAKGQWRSRYLHG